MNRDLIIMFLRTPEKGRVKTRLAATIGDERALDIYERMLYHTVDEVSATGIRREAWYADGIPVNEVCRQRGFLLRLQHKGDLGDRMAYAFQDAFDHGAEKVMIVGTDCPGLNRGILLDAFRMLDNHDVVMGPTRDGGYYLLGTRMMIPELFQRKKWSTSSVAEDTVKDVERSGLSLGLLPQLIDVDTEADLHDVILPERSDPNPLKIRIEHLDLDGLFKHQ